MGEVLLIEPYLITNCVKNWSIFRTPFPSCAADAQRAVPCALSALIGFFVFGAVLCGPLGRIRSGRGLALFDRNCIYSDAPRPLAAFG